MSTNNTTISISNNISSANPLLFTFSTGDTTIQPYWIVIVQILVLQTLNRIYNGITVGVWLTKLEIAFICLFITIDLEVIAEVQKGVGYVLIAILDFWDRLRRLRTFPRLGPQQPHSHIIAYFIPTSPEVKNVNRIPDQSSMNEKERQKLIKKRRKLIGKLQFDLFDIFFYSVPLAGHSIWYCIVQSSCMSAEYATTSNCYDIFGYVLYNHIFVSYFSFGCTFLFKCAYRKKCNQLRKIKNVEKPKSKFRNFLDLISYQLGLWSSILTFIFVGCLHLPYLLTNVLPMAGAYTFIHGIYWAAMVVLFYFAVRFMRFRYVKNLISEERRIYASGLSVAAVIIYTIPLLISTTFNYSQYVYYGQDYIQTMTDEYNSRNTDAYFKIWTESVNSVFHFVLNLF